MRFILTGFLCATLIMLQASTKVELGSENDFTIDVISSHLSISLRKGGKKMQRCLYRSAPTNVITQCKTFIFHCSLLV